MRATVKVLVKDTNILVLKVEAPKYVDVNQVLHPKERGADTSYKVDGWNWRNLYLPPLKDVSYMNKMLYFKCNSIKILSVESYGTMSQLNLLCSSLKVPAEQAQILANPVAFVLDCNGAVREVTVSKDEPEWSINFKKALIVLFQAKVDSYSWELEQNRVSISFNIRHSYHFRDTIDLLQQ